MRFTDLLLIAGVWSLTGCSSMLQKSETAALLQTPEGQCHREVLRVIEALTGLHHPKISEDAFTKSATLVLTNHPRRPFPANDPLVGVAGSEKMVRLYRSGGECRIALLDEAGQIRRSLPLQRCRCIREEKR